MHLVPADADTSDADYAFEVQPTGAVDDIIYIMEYDVRVRVRVGVRVRVRTTSSTSWSTTPPHQP